MAERETELLRKLATATERVTEMEELASSLACARYEALAVMEQRAEQAEARVLEVQREAEEIAQAIPATFYAGTDTLFRVVQLVRIWQGVIRANQELEQRAEQAEARATETKREAHVLATEWQARRDEMIAAHARALGAAGEREGALREYVAHTHECSIRLPIRLPHLQPEPHPCDCGLAALLAKEANP